MSTWGSLAGKDRKKGSETSMNDDDPMTCDEEEIAAVVATNVTGTILGTRAAILALSQQPDGTGGGHIFNMDGAGSTGTATPGFAAYGASKLAISSLHKSVKAELKEASTSSSSKKIDSIALHRLSPGMCTTDLLMKGASRPKAKFFVNVLAEPPEASASFLVPRVREIARKPPSSGPDNAPSAAFLTPVKALGLLLARVTTGARKDRFLVEE
jgi:chlorophyll(ide) b reductase